MSEEQKKKIDGVLQEMKHMTPQQIEVMITYMQGMATAAKLMQAERQDAAQCIKILHEIGMPEDAVLPGDGVAMIGLNSTDRFVARGFHSAGANARSEILDILKNRAFD